MHEIERKNTRLLNNSHWNLSKNNTEIIEGIFDICNVVRTSRERERETWTESGLVKWQLIAIGICRMSWEFHFNCRLTAQVIVLEYRISYAECAGRK